MIKKDDNVYVIAGNDKGRTGKVLARKKNKVIVQGINLRKKNIKKTQQAQATQITMEMPIDISNVALCDKNGEKIKVKTKITAKGKDLVYLKDGKEVVYRTIKKK